MPQLKEKVPKDTLIMQLENAQTTSEKTKSIERFADFYEGFSVRKGEWGRAEIIPNKKDEQAIKTGRDKLTDWLKSEETPNEVKLKIIRFIEKFKIESALDSLEIVFNQNKDPRIRKAIAKAFGEIGDPSALPFLNIAWNVLSDDKDNVKKAVWDAIVKLKTLGTPRKTMHDTNLEASKKDNLEKTLTEFKRNLDITKYLDYAPKITNWTAETLRETSFPLTSDLSPEDAKKVTETFEKDRTLRFEKEAEKILETGVLPFQIEKQDIIVARNLVSLHLLEMGVKNELVEKIMKKIV